MNEPRVVQAICFDWGGTLMSEDGPEHIPMAEWPQVRALPGAEQTLSALGNYRLCVATNASVSRRPHIERALERVGFLQFFSHIFCATELGLRKEQPQFWGAVKEKLGLDAGQIAMVGDTLEPDVLSPMRAGLFAVWFNPTRATAEVSVPTITRLPDLARLVTHAV
jgi:FMN phosphatase YigB (HAD superfamily)